MQPLTPEVGAESTDSDSPRPLSRPELAWEFLKIGTVGVGDLGPLLGFIERDLVEGRRVLTRGDVTEALTYTKPLPGSTVLQVTSYLGYKLDGWVGSTIATWCYLLPSIIAMLLLAAGYVAASAIPAVGPAVNGITAAVVGILLATAYRLAKRSISPKQPITVVLALAAFGAGAFLGVNVAVIVIAAGLAGILLLAPSGTPAKRTDRAN